MKIMSLKEASKVNIVPEMMRSCGAVGDQPEAKNILIDDEYALMNNRDFERLSDHTGSEPATKHTGMMWKGRQSTQE